MSTTFLPQASNLKSSSVTTVLPQASTRESGVTAVEVIEQKVTGSLRLTITSSRMLWGSWHDMKQDRRLTANKTQVMAFAQAGLREATGLATLTVVAVSGGPSDWFVSYEVPAGGMDPATVTSLSDQVRQKLSRLEDTNSPEFESFTRGAASSGSSLQLQSIAVVSGPTAQLSVDLDPVSGAIVGAANGNIFAVAFLALLGVALGHC